MQKFKRNRIFLSFLKNSSLVFQKGFVTKALSASASLHLSGFCPGGSSVTPSDDLGPKTKPNQRFLNLGSDLSSKTTQVSLDCFPLEQPKRRVFPKTTLRSSFHSSFFEKNGNFEETLFFNFAFDKGRLKTLVCWFFEKHGQYKTLQFLEKLKEVGFGSATSAGISLGIDDLKIPSQKIALVSRAETKVAKDFVQYRNAKITGIERIQRLIYTWNQTNDTLKQEVVRLFESTDLFNPIYMMAFSGARGNMSQVRQLVGMRGLMSDPQGQIIDFPIQSNFREGLTLTEYLISTYGARKGIVDTALRTATAGYLTRRLVDVAQHTIVSKFDCGTMRGIFLFDMKDGKKTIYSFQNRLVGRVLAQNIELFHKETEKNEVKKKQLAFRNQEIDSKLAQALSKVTKKAFVRSPLTCETSRFVCQLCYGWSLSHGKLVSVGEAVGILAAQSIGEPGTQLTMRTFHTGGVFAGGLTDQILAPFDGKMKYLKNIPGSCVRNALSEIAFLTKMPGSFFVEKALPFFQEEKQELSLSNRSPLSKRKKAEIFTIPAYAVLFCRNHEHVRKKQVLAQFSSVFKKVQYGRAEQTLYSTFAGEFVFGKSFFFAQNSKSQSHSGRPPNQRPHRFLQSEGAQVRFMGKAWPTYSQRLLLEKRKGDFSEVESKRDSLWKSQNWTTVWILSGNVFCDSLNRNFPFEEGDFLKKTSVLQRILWTKKKNSKYFLSGSFLNRVCPKTKKNEDYLLAFEQKKNQNSFLFELPFFEKSHLQFLKNVHKKRILQDMNKNDNIRNVQTYFNVQFLNRVFANKKKKNSISNSFHKSFFTFQHDIQKIFPFSRSFMIDRDHTHFFESEKKESFCIQNKSARFLLDFQKNIQNPLKFLQKNRNCSGSFFSKAQKRKTESLISQKKGATSFFFRFGNKRKNCASPLFLNFMTFSKTFHVSLKFCFSSFLLNGFSETLFLRSHFIFLKKNSKKNLFSSSTAFLPFENSYTHSFVQNQKVWSFSRLFQKRQGRKKTVFKTSLFFAKALQNTKDTKHEKNLVQNKNTNREKNIFLKKFFLRLPVEKISYTKFAYFVSLSAKGEKKKVKSSFQTFSALTSSYANNLLQQTKKEENSLIEQRSFGKAAPLSFESQNFYGKEGPHSFSNCFFQDSQTNTGGIFSFCLFEQRSKKQRILYFCEKFSENDKNQVVFLKPENVQKRYSLHPKKQEIPFLSLSVDIGFRGSHLCIFQIPTFSFLFFSTHSFLKAFFRLPEKKRLFQSAEKTKNNEKNDHFQNFFSGKKAWTVIDSSIVDSTREGEGTHFSKIEFFGFSTSLFQKEKNQNDKKRSSLFLSTLSFQKKFHAPLTLSFEKKREKSFPRDLYTQEILWLPRENLVLFTSDIFPSATSSEKEENMLTFSSFPFYLHSGKRPFLFFANRQGKKKIFSFFPKSFSDTKKHFQKERKQKGFDGFLRISKRKMLSGDEPKVHSHFSKTENQSSFVSEFKANKKTKAFSPLHQKFSFFPQSKKEKQKSARVDAHKKDFRAFFVQVEKKILFHQSFRKNIALKFQKRIGNENFKNIQRIFLKKTLSFQSLSPHRIEKISHKSLPLLSPKLCSNVKKPTTVFQKHFKNSYFFAKKAQSQCFACLPFQKNSPGAADRSFSFQSKNEWDHEKRNFSGKTKKCQLQVDQGWIVFPFSPCLRKIVFNDRQKIQKKGHFSDKNATFEQNAVFVETVLFQNSSFFCPNSQSNSFQKPEKRSFRVDFVKTNTKCRYFSFSSFQEKRKRNQESFEISSSFQKAVQFPHFFPYTKMKRFNVVQFFRPFQYTILQNPQNAKKSFTDIRFHYFSKAISTPCFELYKKYHSTFFNLQKKEFWKIFPNSQSQKNHSFKFDVQSNFQNLYFSKEQSPFLSFHFSREKENFKKNLKKMQTKRHFQEISEAVKGKSLKGPEFQKYFQKQLFSNQRIRNQVGRSIHKQDFESLKMLSSPSLKTFRGNFQKTFFFSFENAQKEKKKFSFYPVEFLPLLLSLSTSNSKIESVGQSVSLPSSSPTFSFNPFQNTIEFQLFSKKGTFFDERFFSKTFFDFVQTSSFWLNKEKLNFLFSTVLRQKNFQKIQVKENPNCLHHSVFEKNIRFYGSTEFMSPYKGEILSMLTHNMYWWKKASEISTLQSFEKLFLIVTKKDFFSVQFPVFSNTSDASTQVVSSSAARQEKLGSFSFSRSTEFNVLKQKQHHFKKLYEVLTLAHQKNCFLVSKDQNKTTKKTKISSFVTKYEKRIYTFQNLTVGYPSLFQKPLVGNFVVYGDNFFGSSVQKPGQIIHVSSSSMTLRRGQPCLVSSNGILHFSNTPFFRKNVPLVTLPYQTVQAGDIVQGIPKVEQFFEARTTLQGRLFVSSLPILLKGLFERYKILFPLEQATRQSFLKIQQIVVDGVQRVYRSQGVSITDKHLEVVVRQMTTKVQILNGAQTGFFPGELIQLDFVERLNTFLMVKICYEPVILGITRASLEVDSFLSASSFQQTTKILSLAALSRKKDFLKGLKENLLVGNLIPSGTGYFQFSKRL